MAAQFGRRLRRGAATTAVAAVAMAALTASQAPDLLDGVRPGQTGGSSPAADTPIDGDSPYHTDLPPLQTPDGPATDIDPPATGDAAAGIPATVLDAYKKAEAALAESRPGCHLPWQLLAAIGKVESGQARGGAVDSEGTTVKPILGPQLNGAGFANISDTDGGAYDGDTTHDRAVGPMQFIPSTWASWGADGNGDGEKNPNNIYDAALAAGEYLCAGGRDLSDKADLDRAILGYNHSQEYLRTVLSWFEYYKKGTHEVPDGTGVLPTSPGSGSDPADGAKGPGSSGSSGTGGSGGGSAKPGGSDGSGGTGSGKPRPTLSATGIISPAPGDGSASPGGSESPVGTENPGTSPTECPISSADPSGSASSSDSPSPSGSESSSGGASSSGAPTTAPAPSNSASGTPSTDPSGASGDSPCGDGSYSGSEPDPSNTGMAAGIAAAQLA
jgi:hypothetical protein